MGQAAPMFDIWVEEMARAGFRLDTDLGIDGLRDRIEIGYVEGGLFRRGGELPAVDAVTDVQQHAGLRVREPALGRDDPGPLGGRTPAPNAPPGP